MSHGSIDPIQRTLTVPASPERAFTVFTDEFATWWPPGPSITGALILTRVTRG